MASFSKYIKDNNPELYPDNLLIVDFLNLSFRFKHQNATASFSSEMLRLIQSLAKSYQCGAVLICADFGSSTFRKALHPDYKGNRKEKYKDQTDEEKEEFKKFLENYEEAYDFVSHHFYHCRYKGVEADDTMAYAAKVLSQDDNINMITLVSTDGDMDQMLADNVQRFSYKTRKEYTVHNFFETHKCDNPEQFTSIKVLMGDSGDNVFGIPEIGPKRAYNLVKEYGDAYTIYDNLPLEGKQVFIRNVNNSGELIPLNYQLMDLPSFCEDAIGEENLELLNVIINQISQGAATL